MRVVEKLYEWSLLLFAFDRNSLFLRDISEVEYIVHYRGMLKSEVFQMQSVSSNRRTKHSRWSKLLLAGAVLGSLTLSAPARADLILIGPALIQPAGPGVVPTILDFQSQGNATDETGRTSFNGTTSVTTSLVNPAGAAQPGVDTTVITGGANNQARTLAELGVGQASDLRIFFNINEPTPTADVLLRTLIVTAYDTTGASVFMASLAAPLTLTEIGSGAGTSDYAFGLTALQAADLQAVFSSDLRIGIEASISDAQGGPESFFGGSANTDTVIPEPTTLLLLGAGLFAAGFARRRTKSV
ncbi:MAG: PEP-CTERM sorting domain-containing protein [Burkholderiaceae bacterium]